MSWRGPGLRYAAPISVKVVGILCSRLIKRLAVAGAAARSVGDTPVREAKD
jgi:hypothetical protein